MECTAAKPQSVATSGENTFGYCTWLPKDVCNNLILSISYLVIGNIRFCAGWVFHYNKPDIPLLKRSSNIQIYYRAKEKM